MIFSFISGCLVLVLTLPLLKLYPPALALASASTTGTVSSNNLNNRLEATATGRCRTLPEDPTFPSSIQWSQLNSSINGRLLAIVPSAKFCKQLPCTEAEWESDVFRSNIPGAMLSYNWEQDYTSNPPSLCLQNGTTCGQGNVPVFGINATEASHIQVGIKFASTHNLKVVIKASGHDYLGRSTARGSLLLWTHHLQNITFFDSFVIGGKNQGSAVSVGSGVPANQLYVAANSVGKFLIAPVTTTAVLPGGYAQGAGHSAFSLAYGLAADNALEYKIVLANGSLVTANSMEHSDLFWALRGGGGGSWGVIIEGTYRTYPQFNATIHSVDILAATNESTEALMTLHAQHIFDWEPLNAGQYYYLVSASLLGGVTTSNVLSLSTYFPNFTTAEEAVEVMKPFLDAASTNVNFTVFNESTVTGLANEVLYTSDTTYGGNTILGSRLIPAEVYRSSPSRIGKTHRQLLEDGVTIQNGIVIGGGKVAGNADMNSAVTQKWRTAKVHYILSTSWDDSIPPSGVEAIKEKMTKEWVPVLASATGESDSGSYMNEGNVREPNFETTFFGTNYGRLKGVKAIYDPDDLFIVGAGVGSENWDVDGICRVND